MSKISEMSLNCKVEIARGGDCDALKLQWMQIVHDKNAGVEIAWGEMS